MSKVTENQGVKVETKKTTTKKETTRSILGKKLGQKLPKEVEATIEVIKANKEKQNVPFNTLYNEYLTVLVLIGGKVGKNSKTRFRRCLYRNVESAIVKNSIQSAKFNIIANLQGIKIKTEKPIEYKINGDAVTSSVDNNNFHFIVSDTTRLKKKVDLTDSLIARANKFKESNK